MENTPISFESLGATFRRFAQRLLIIGENRFELLALEVQEERERLLHAILLALGVATLGLLAGITLTATIVVALWAYSPVVALLTLTCLYGVAGAFLYQRLLGRLRNWPTLSSTLDQLRKDRICLEKTLE